ncbi:MAG: epimerase [Rhodocyclales bacterium]|nr:epimerase [Rhodocyclales bacterium]
MSIGPVGVLGVASLVGPHLVRSLRSHVDAIFVFSRKNRSSTELDGVHWRHLDPATNYPVRIREWICLAPIWIVPDYFDWLLRAGVHKIVTVSSTSRFSKLDSSSDDERALAARLADAEDQLKIWAEQHGVQWVILRPTMIYGDGLDRNVSDIARFLRRWRFFPVAGSAGGLRQPIHAADVAEFCVRALLRTEVTNLAFDICGGETLSYRDMVTRIGAAMGQRVRFVSAPRTALRFGIRLLTALPRFKGLSPALVDRTAQDLVFDSSNANLALGVQPRPFILTEGDLPSP